MAEFLVESNPNSISRQAYTSRLIQYLQQYELTQLEAIAKCNSTEKHYACNVHCSDLIEHDSALAFTVIHYPQMMLPLFDDATRHVLGEIVKVVNGKFKIHCHIRITSLPHVSHLAKSVVNDVTSDSSRSLLQLSGTIVRTHSVRMLEVSKQFECHNPKCRHKFTVYADPEQDYMISQPRSCPNVLPQLATETAKLQSSDRIICNSTSIRELEGSRVCVDFQEIKVQDKMDRLALGSTPRSISVILQADLVDQHHPGDDVTVVGTIVRQWRPVGRGMRCSVDIVIVANSIKMLSPAAGDGCTAAATNADEAKFFQQFWQSHTATPFSGRDFIVKSGSDDAGAAATVSDNYGDERTRVSASAGGAVKRRCQSHLLMVGDPGCGKSQLLRFAAKVSRRSVMTTGIGTTGAGLTCTAVKDGNDWSIEAGALVLANDGVCCIDEFSSIREGDRATIHESMEQQTLSVAKAGLVVRLSTRATVIACCNPKGSYDVTQDLSVNTAIAAPLLSRFDLILVLMDVPEKEWDTRVSTFLLQQALSDGMTRRADSTRRNIAHAPMQDVPTSTRERGEPAAAARRMGDTKLDDCWSIGRLAAYVEHVKRTCRPSLNAEARALLLRHYQMQRQSDDQASGRSTVRLLESSLRLAEAHAKLMHKSVADLSDAVVAVVCCGLAGQQASLLDVNKVLQSDFPDNAEMNYQEQERETLQLLHCTRQILSQFACAATNDSTSTSASSTAANLALSQLGDQTSHVHRSQQSSSTMNSHNSFSSSNSSSQLIRIPADARLPRNSSTPPESQFNRTNCLGAISQNIARVGHVSAGHVSAAGHVHAEHIDNHMWGDSSQPMQLAGKRPRLDESRIECKSKLVIPFINKTDVDENDSW